MQAAYKHADGKKIDGRRVLVDVERARTVKGWRPRRLGGGLGGTRKGGPDMNTKYSGREENAISRDDRSESRDRDRRRRRSRSKSRDRGRRGGRSRSRERKWRSRSRERRRSKERKPEDEEDTKKRRRSRSRDKKRSRSRDRKRSRRSRSRDRKRDRSRERREREKEEARAAGEAAGVNIEMIGDGPYTGMKPENGVSDAFDPNIVIKEEKLKPEYDKYAKQQVEEMQSLPEDQQQEGEELSGAAPPPVAPPVEELPQTNEYGSYEEVAE